MIGTKVFYRKWIPDAKVGLRSRIRAMFTSSRRLNRNRLVFTLHLEFETDLPLHQVVDHTTLGRGSVDDVRHTLYDQRLLCDQNMNYDREADYTRSS